MAYLEAEVLPGDSLTFWKFDELCQVDNAVASGKQPDAQGRVPKGGSY